MTDFNLMQGDCLELMQSIPDGLVDMVLTDPPYGTTACKWDTVIDLDVMWAQLKRIVKPDGAIVMTAAQPFTSALVMSNPKMYRHQWVWDKATISNPMQAKHQPLRQHEDVLVFSAKRPEYLPQKTDLHLERKWRQAKQHADAAVPAKEGAKGVAKGKYPKTIQRFNAAKFEGKTIHPTQKPVALMEYMIKTYTHEGDAVLDFTMGSGTTGVACANLGRSFIGIELDADYFDIAEKRIQEARNNV